MSHHLLQGDEKGVVAENARALKHGGRSERDAVVASLKKADGLVHMKRDKPKKTANSVTPSEPDADDYGYGLRLDLDDDSLTKLGMTKKLPAVGSVLHLTAKGHVRSTSENSSEGEDDGKTRRSLSVQITHLKVGSRAEEA